jgi:hypothetical protein
MPAPPTERPDRYEPLPGLFGLPGFLFRKLGRHGKVAAAVIGGLALAGLVVAAIVLVPEIGETKRERAAEERRELAAGEARRRQRLIAEQRPHRARSQFAPALSPAERGAVRGQIETAITRDQRARVRRGTLDPPPALYATCEPFAGERPGVRVSRLSCTAVTSEVLREGTKAGVVGHPFLARVDYETGRYAWCKVSGRAGEGAFRSVAPVPVPRICGGR